MIPVLIGLGVLAAAGSTAYFWNDIFGSDEVKKAWNNKTIVILGDREVGKTALIHFLKYGKIITEYEQTLAEKVGKFHTEIDGVKLKLLINLDLGGSSIAYSKWNDEIKKADYIFYMIDINEIINNNIDHIKKIKNDLNHISSTVINKKESKVFLIANKSDKVLLDKKNSSELEQYILKKSVILETILKLGGHKKCQLIIGSLKDVENAKKMIKDIVNRNFS